MMFSALGAFILSMLIGLISGNPAAVVFVRAIVSALLFSAVVFGGLYLLRRYIPEFEDGSEEAADEITDVEGVPVPSSEGAAPSLEEGIGSPLGGDTGPLPPVTADASSESQLGGTGMSMEELQSLADVSDGSSLNGLEDITLGNAEENGNGVVEDLPSLDKLYEEHEQVSVPDIGPSDVGSKAKSKAVGDYIEVGNARIPFEPEVLAKAVKKVMKQDE